MKENIPGFNNKQIKIITWGLRSIGFVLFSIIVIAFFQLLDIKLIKLLEKTGNTFNGLTAPFIGILVAILTYMAFFIQYKANELQRLDISLERFENKFYEMLHLHRENLNDIKIEQVYSGRECFEIQYYEFKCVYKLLNKILEENNASFKSHEYLENWAINISYYHFYNGVNKNTLPISQIDFEIELEIILIKNLYSIIENFSNHKNYLRAHSKNIKDYPFYDQFLHKNNTTFCYTPFQGYVSQLGHYYRHLYQTFKLATTDKTLSKIDPVEEFKYRYQYVKLGRVQMSGHEQLMIYYNSYFTSGKIWWEDADFTNPWNEPLSYFLDYAIIKNLPLELTKNIGNDPVVKFKKHLNERVRKNRHIPLSIEKLFEQIGG